jgi:glycosyltransferase domain-containing protein
MENLEFTYMIGIVIPTKNRADYLIRQLRYYSYINCPFSIYIGDGSDEGQSKKIINAVRELADKVDIVYKHWPELNITQTMKKLAELVTDEFCAFSGDDDFLVPSALNKCARFLKENPDYRLAYGNGLVFKTKNDLAYGNLLEVSNYMCFPAFGQELDDPFKRLALLSSRSRSPWGVHRTAEYCEDIAQIEDKKDVSTFLELFVAFTISIQGKTRYIDCLYVARQIHDERSLGIPLLEWLIGSDWYPSFWFFHDALVEKLIVTTKCSTEKASEGIKRAFQDYLNLRFKKAVEAKPTAATDNLKNYVKKIPGVVNCIRSIRRKSMRVVPVSCRQDYTNLIDFISHPPGEDISYD